ncbi:unnamed protein product [marine sediment metagenome]|uniref:Uncharacterized protein n=1 Tax=marine sediment metagenome TaxID=412755 RepID=X1SPE0_9ZZZZ
MPFRHLYYGKGGFTLRGTKRVGFWGEDKYSKYSKIDDEWNNSEQRDIVLSYLLTGIAIAGWAGNSRCRACGAPNGSLDIVTPDGKWYHPNGYFHYILDHNVKPPDELISDAITWSKEPNVEIAEFEKKPFEKRSISVLFPNMGGRCLFWTKDGYLERIAQIFEIQILTLFYLLYHGGRLNFFCFYLSFFL